MREHGTIQKVSPPKCVIVGVGSPAPEVRSRYGGDPGPRHLEAPHRREPKKDHPRSPWFPQHVFFHVVTLCVWAAAPHCGTMKELQLLFHSTVEVDCILTSVIQPFIWVTKRKLNDPIWLFSKSNNTDDEQSTSSAPLMFLVLALISNVSFFVADVCWMKSAQICCAALAECEPLLSHRESVLPSRPLTRLVFTSKTHICVSVCCSRGHLKYIWYTIKFYRSLLSTFLYINLASLNRFERSVEGFRFSVTNTNMGGGGWCGWCHQISSCLMSSFFFRLVKRKSVFTHAHMHTRTRFCPLRGRYTDFWLTSWRPWNTWVPINQRWCHRLQLWRFIVQRPAVPVRGGSEGGPELEAVTWAQLELSVTSVLQKKDDGGSEGSAGSGSGAALCAAFRWVQMWSFPFKPAQQMWVCVTLWCFCIILTDSESYLTTWRW